MALIDILSDTHFDNWFGYPHQGNKNKLSPPKDAIVGFWRKLKPQGDYLILAGDIGHSIEQNINILKIPKLLVKQKSFFVITKLQKAVDSIRSDEKSKLC